MGSNFTDALKAKTQQILQATSQRASESIKQGTEVVKTTVETKAKQATQQLSNQATKVMEQGTRHANEALQRGTAATTEALQSATKQATQASLNAFTQTSSSIKERSKAAVTATSETIQTTTKRWNVWERAQEFGQRLARWFFWWSLAAIGVYALATAIPSALLRYAFTSSSNNSGTPQSSSLSSPSVAAAPPSTDSTNSWSWISSPTPSAGVQSQPEQPSSTTNSWSTFWGSGKE